MEKKIRLANIDPNDTGAKHEREEVGAEMERLKERLEALQNKLYAGKKQSVLFVIQGWIAVVKTA